ncbi:MAG: hypothetical protein P8Y66_06915 [Nitrospirota bacterium]
MLSEGGPQSGAPELGPDIEKEKQKNVKIAIGIAAAGITGGIFIYVVLFALMFLFPFAVFSFLPDMEFPRDMVSLEGKKLLVFTESVNPPRSWEEPSSPEAGPRRPRCRRGLGVRASAGCV